MIKRTILAGAMLINLSTMAFAEEVPLTPNPEITYGDYCSPDDPNFVEYRYEEDVAYCRRAVSRHMKKHIYTVYQIPEGCKENYTVDHLIPLAMGGSNKPENLWPEHKRIKATRRTLEQELYDKLRRGEISQKEAVETIVNAKKNPPGEAVFLDAASCQK